MAAADRKRAGATLLEVVVALVILAVAGVGLLSLSGETADALDTMLRRERMTRSAAAQLEGLALRSRLEMINTVGTHRVAAVDVNVSQLSSTLFEVAVTDTTNGAVVLRTTLYRPEAPSDSTR